jgi:hypothetical protein
MQSRLKLAESVLHIYPSTVWHPARWSWLLLELVQSLLRQLVGLLVWLLRSYLKQGLFEASAAPAWSGLQH